MCTASHFTPDDKIDIEHIVEKRSPIRRVYNEADNDQSNEGMNRFDHFFCALHVNMEKTKEEIYRQFAKNVYFSMNTRHASLAVIMIDVEVV